MNKIIKWCVIYCPLDLVLFRWTADTGFKNIRIFIIFVSYFIDIHRLCNSHTHKSKLFTITYHYGRGSWKSCIQVMWLSLHNLNAWLGHHKTPIDISSYVCFECHWAVLWNSTPIPTGNIHDPFLLPAMLTIPEMTSLIWLSFNVLSHHSLLYSNGIRLAFICFCIILPFDFNVFSAVRSG